MAAEVRLTPLTDRGRALLDELERRTEMQPTETHGDGSRTYYFSAKFADVDGFDAMLTRIDSDWRDHLTR